METMLTELKDALRWFYHYQEIFKDLDICDSFSLPRQHSMKHYHALICLFGASNGGLYSLPCDPCESVQIPRTPHRFQVDFLES